MLIEQEGVGVLPGVVKNALLECSIQSEALLCSPGKTPTQCQQSRYLSWSAVSQHKKDRELVEQVQRQARKMIRGLARSPMKIG